MTDELSRNERIKEASDYLRGTLADGLREEITGAIVEDDAQLVKFHGMYLQDDRDLRPERTRKKMEKAFAFMIRVRIPGGVLTPQQWLALDKVARDYGNGTMRLTTRQTVQLARRHQIEPEGDAEGDRPVLLNSIAACGDISRSHVQCAAGAVARVMRKRSTGALDLRPSAAARRPIARSGSTASASRAARRRVGADLRQDPICRANSRSWWRCRPNDVDIFAHDLSATSRSRMMPRYCRLERDRRRRHGHDHGEPTPIRASRGDGFCRTEDV
jgi:sulfite reductase (NADPH) hemoprotein beta-component